MSTQPASSARRLRQLSLRARLMIIGVSGVAVALVAGGFALFGILTLTVNRTLDAQARATGSDVATMVAEDRLPSPIPVSGAQLIQVVDGDARVIGASLLADRLTPLLQPDELAQALAGGPLEVPGSRAGLSGPLRVTAIPTEHAGVSVLVAQQVGDVLAARRTLRNALLLTFPVLLAVLAAIAWRVIGQTLRPVEALRTGAERISGGQEAERLPVPESADEIRALAVTLNGMLDRLEAARLRQRSFVADAAHELRSPLTSIRTQLEVARHLREAGQLPADLLVDVDRLSALVEDLLLLARSDADRPRPGVPETLEVGSVLSELAQPIQRVTVTVRAESTVFVEADRSELRRAIANLVDNAVRHASSRVELAVRRDRTHAVITVSDDGPGIVAADRERVFDRFTRLDDARARDAGGSGLGLAIVRELVTRAGGSVRLIDPGSGWSLQALITLPAAQAPARPALVRE